MTGKGIKNIFYNLNFFVMEKEGNLLEECPNCGSFLGVGSEEYEWQCCDSCGYPDCAEGYDEEEENNDDDNFD